MSIPIFASLYEDNAGTLSLHNGERTWVFVGTAPPGATFADDAAAMAAGEDGDWLDMLGPLDHPHRYAVAPQGAVVAVWSPAAGVQVFGPLGAAARAYLGMDEP